MIEHPFFSNIFVTKTGIIYNGNEKIKKLNKGDTIEINGKEYYDFEFYEPIKTQLNKSIQNQIKPVYKNIYKLHDFSFYNTETKQISNYVFENEFFGLDEFNEVYDKKTKLIISNHSRVRFEGKNFSRVNLINDLSGVFTLNENERIITFNPSLNKTKYCFDNLVKINLNDKIIKLSEGEFKKSKNYNTLYYKNKRIFNILSHHITTFNNFYTIKLHHTYKNLTYDEITTNEILNKTPLTVIKHKKFTNYGYDEDNKQIYSFITNSYIKTRPFLKLYQDKEVINVSLDVFLRGLK